MQSLWLRVLIAVTLLQPAYSQNGTHIDTPADMSSAERAAWSKEEAYWRDLKSGDYDSYLKLWDERFAGWPAAEPLPVHKDNIRRHTSPITSRKILDYKLEPLSVRQYGQDIVIAIYRSTSHTTDSKGADERTSTARLTHTWMKEKDGWYIMGGMSCLESGQTK
jgi:ketosteroid isomerase-like protein